MVETYSKTDTKPFGGNIAYRQIEAMFANNIIRSKKLPFKNTWQNMSDTSALYVCIVPKLYTTEDDVQAMMEYVYAGNSLFISTSRIDDLLLEKVGCKEIFTEPYTQNLLGVMKDTKVSIGADSSIKFGYYYYPFENYFKDLNTADTKVLGYNDDGKPDYIVHFYGKGKLYLHCEPRAFSNYFLLKDDNYKYLQNCFAFTSDIPQHIYWDDFYNKTGSRRKSSDGKSYSSLSEIMKYPPLVFAFWLALILLGLYILFGSKRIQRIIAHVKPNENTTVTFTETVGRLYLQEKDNKNIADKMITYFNEYIRNTYFLNSSHVDDDFILMLSRKSGVEKDKVETLYRTIADTHKSSVVNDYQLLSLQTQIQQFYKNKA